MTASGKPTVTLMGKVIQSSAPKPLALPLTPDDEVISHNNQTTRKVLRSEYIHQNARDATAKVRVTLSHQRRSSKANRANEEWQDIDAVPLSSLHADEKVQLALKSGETKNLFKALARLYSQAGTLNQIMAELDQTVVERTDALVLTGPLKERIAKWISEEPDEFFDYVESMRSDLLDTLAVRTEHRKRKAALEVFEQELERNLEQDSGAWVEREWETFFRENTWIFGHGLAYQFLQEVQAQPHYGGTGLDGKGAQRGDSMLRTSADVRFTVLVDIKRPDTPLLMPKAYRGEGTPSAVYRIAPDLAGGTAQIQANCATWYRKGSQEKDAMKLAWVESTFTHEPKGVLVIGTTSEFFNEHGQADEAKAASFERFRRFLHNPEILTFDELFARARAMLESSPRPDHVMDEDIDDLPF